jgi:hypothetical protein
MHSAGKAGRRLILRVGEDGTPDLAHGTYARKPSSVPARGDGKL